MNKKNSMTYKSYEGKPMLLDDFEDANDMEQQLIDAINKVAKDNTHMIDRYFLTGFKLLSIRKLKRLRKWVFKAMKKKQKKEANK